MIIGMQRAMYPFGLVECNNYDVLNKYLAGANQPEQIHKMVNSLISLLQDSIRMGEEKVFTTLTNELEISKYYCDIQQIMYPDCFELLIDIEDDLLSLRVPKSILQPLVENAIWHGKYSKADSVYLCGRCNIFCGKGGGICNLH